MSRLDKRQHDGPKIKITTKDISTPEKVKKFIKLFGRDNYYAAYHDLSEKIYGDGTQQKIESRMAANPLRSDDDRKAYEQMRDLRKAAAKKTQSYKKASVQLPVTRQTFDRVFENEEMAKNYIGIERFLTAAGLGHGMAAATEENLLNNNQAIQAVESHGDKLRNKIKKQEERLRKLKNDAQNYSRGQEDDE